MRALLVKMAEDYLHLDVEDLVDIVAVPEVSAALEKAGIVGS